MLFIMRIFYIAESGRINLIGFRIVLCRQIHAGYLTGYISQLGIKILEHQAGGPDSQCIVPTQPRQIVDQNDLQSITCSRQGGRTSGDSASYYDQVGMRNLLRMGKSQ